MNVDNAFIQLRYVNMQSVVICSLYNTSDLFQSVWTVYSVNLRTP